MAVRGLIINKQVRADLRRLQEHAAQNIVETEDLKRMAAGELPVPGDSEEHVVYVPIGFRVVYSMERQEEPLGLCHHLSVSLIQDASAETYPHPAAVTAIMAEIGFEGGINQCVSWLEQENRSANIVQPVGQALNAEFLETAYLDPGKGANPVKVRAKEEGE